jgi:hypothetical protein
LQQQFLLKQSDVSADLCSLSQTRTRPTPQQ